MGDRPGVPAQRFKVPEGRWHLHNERLHGVPFDGKKTTRLTVCTLEGGPEENTWIVYNVAALLHVAPFDQVNRDPYRTVVVSTNAHQLGQAQAVTCHAFHPAKDGNDLLVGLADGQVVLMSLRSHILAAVPAKHVTVACTLTPEVGPPDSSRCVSVAWVPRSDAGMFVAAMASGSVFVYKKASLMDSGSKFLSIGSAAKAQAPLSSFSVPGCAGGGLHDIAVSPDGLRLAAACRDGALRLLDMSSWSLVGGFQSYYGALLCCAFSPDGKYVATGGEDDLVALYGVQERYCVQHGEGHASWVSRVAFDAWAATETAGMVGGGGGSPPRAGAPPAPPVYRVASAGQDAALCMWDLTAPQDGDFSAASLLASMPMKRNASLGAMAHLGLNDSAPKHDRKQSLSKATGICPSLPRMDMYIVQPHNFQRVHLYPLTDVLFTKAAMYTADATGVVRCWQRPLGPAQAQDSMDLDA